MCSIAVNPVNLIHCEGCSTYSPVNEKMGIPNEINRNPLTSSPGSNHEIIQEIFAQKLIQYSSLGHFPQIYEPSLQATYYVLYILEAIGKLNEINQTAMINFIKSHYDENSGTFMDNYAYRYLDTDFSQSYYPYTTVLEVNCYAILSLDILSRLDLIDSRKSRDFILSCFNPEGSENGFIGQPYDPQLLREFKIATMDNTYFAIKTLDLLINDWNGYNYERTRLINYINSLQSLNTLEWYFGGFYNDNDTNFDSLGPFEYNLLSSYYCIKSLDIFNLVSSIRMGDFHQHLSNYYNTTGNFFRMNYFSGMERYCNLVATSLGLELSDITGFSGINRAEVINFILTHRNDLGNWDASTRYKYHELIDTFQIIRSLKESGVINQLSTEDKDEIANATTLYHQNNGFSLLSNDYMSINLIDSIVNSFDLFDRIPDLDIQELYNIIIDCYRFAYPGYCFSGITNLDKNLVGFRSFPIEYYNSVHHNHYLKTDLLFSYKNAYMALNSLLKMFKLDDFSLQHDLMDLVNDIIDSQFLDPGYQNYGGFLPCVSYSLGSPEWKNKKIYLEYSYYAIKTLELLVDHLNLESITNLTFNKETLYGYINQNIIETKSIIYFNTQYTSNLEIILENTYYMIYILKALNLYDLDNQKIKNSILQYIDYENIQSIYYSYKISEILDLNIDFNINLTQNLVKLLYSEVLNEFFLSRHSDDINQEVFLWICEMAKNGDLKIECDYTKSLPLGSVNTITASFKNLILNEFGQSISVMFESDQFGILNLEEQGDNTYQLSLLVPDIPKYFPYVEGILKIYDKSKIIGQIPIFFQTVIEQHVRYSILRDAENVWFKINISRNFSPGNESLYMSVVGVDIFRNNSHIQSQLLNHEEFPEYSQFSLSYTFKNSGDYYFNFSLIDDYYPSGLFLFDYEAQQIVNQEIPPIPPSPNPIPDKIKIKGPFLALLGLGITIIAIAGIVKTGRWIKREENEGRRECISFQEKSVRQEDPVEKFRDIRQIIFDDWE